MRRFAWYGRLSTKDKQDPTLSFPSQRRECEAKVAELGGRIVCDFTDQESGWRDDRAGWAELVREAKEREVRRFDAVIIYATSRLSRELFHALSFERELTRVGVEVLYALTSGDQTSPEGRLMRHMFRALDQFEVEKLGREVRRGQTENTRQGYRNGGRAPHGYRLRHEPHPDPARARAGDTKSRLVVNPEQAPVIVEMFSRFLSGSGYAEIADHLNRPGGPPSARHVDIKRNTSGRWSKSTIRSMLDNPFYTGRLFWNRLTSVPSSRVRGRSSAGVRRSGSPPSGATRRSSPTRTSNGSRSRCGRAAPATPATGAAERRSAFIRSAASSTAPPATTRCACTARAARATTTTPAATGSPTATPPPRRTATANGSTSARTG
jgi:DNA invertase Pin-like site-specific DNA recombinase